MKKSYDEISKKLDQAYKNVDEISRIASFNPSLTKNSQQVLAVLSIMKSTFIKDDQDSVFVSGSNCEKGITNG